MKFASHNGAGWDQNSKSKFPSNAELIQATTHATSGLLIA